MISSNSELADDTENEEEDDEDTEDEGKTSRKSDSAKVFMLAAHDRVEDFGHALFYDSFFANGAMVVHFHIRRRSTIGGTFVDTSAESANDTEEDTIRSQSTPFN